MQTHPEFDRIKLIYADAPSMLKECDDTPLAIILNDSLHQSKCIIKVLADVAQLSPVTLINTAITLVSAMIKQQPSHDIKIWQAYDQLNTLKRQYQVAHNLNEKALVDRISCVLTPLAAYAV
jgi:precorrin-4 methylase